MPKPHDRHLENPTGREYVQLVVVLGGLIAIGPLTIDMYLPAFPAIGKDLLATEAQVQLTLTGMLLGLSLGQLVSGPAADSLGRRRLRIAGLVLHAVASVLCALAPSVGLLAAARVVQGVAGSAITVTSMATVRDLFRGSAAARLMSHLMLVMGVAPILAPTIGGAVLQVTTWRGVFVVLGAFALLQMLLVWRFLPETLPRHRRRSMAPRATLATYRSLLGDRMFLALVATVGLMFATMFSYVSGASFVLQEHYGFSAQQFGIAFGVNAVGLIILTQLNPVLMRTFSPYQLLRAGVVMAVTAAVAMLVLALTWGHLLGVLVPLAVIVASCGLCFPNAPALALSRHGEAAGSAAALMGCIQFGAGGLISPLTGLLPGDGALPMATVMAGTTVTALVLVLWLGPHARAGALDD
ncbi:multidrug effflux MFS transporter [Kytococcus sp. Marseille-QA3725]